MYGAKSRTAGLHPLQHLCATGNDTMRKFLAGGLGLFLGLWISSANARETPEHPKLIADSTSEQPPVVTLGRPIAIASSPSNPVNLSADQQVVPAGFAEPLLGLPRALLGPRSSESPQP